MRAILLTLVLAGLPSGLGRTDTVELDQGVEFLGMEAPSEMAAGGRLPIDLYFRFERPLGEDYWIFTHVELGGERFRRLVADGPPEAAGEDGIVRHHVVVDVPADVDPARFEVYTGVWNRRTDARLGIVSPASMDDRVHAGWVRMLPQGSTVAGGKARVFTPRDMRMQKVWVVVRPWAGWAVGLVAAIAATIALARMRRRYEAHVRAVLYAPDPGPRLWASMAILVVPLVLTILAALDFVKDDAYISFRYAHNLVTGHGFVFNEGDRLEGITNLLWTLALAPFEAMGWDLFQVSEVLGTLLCTGLVIAMTLIAAHVTGARRGLSHLWAAVWISTSSSMGLWATSGMEQPLAMFLPVASLALWWRNRECAGSMLASGVLMALGCMTRPEIHLMGMIAGVTILGEAAWKRRVDRGTALWVVGCLGLILPFHAARYMYFGSLVANTFYVKTGASVLLMIRGLEKLHDMFGFNLTGILLVLAPLAFLDRRHLKEKIVLLLVAVGFMLYIVKVGVDEMEWHRLYLPAMPFLVMVAAMGLQNLVDAIGGLAGSRKGAIAAAAAAWALVATSATWNIVYTARTRGGWNGRGELSGTYHPDMGKFITRHERPGALVAFQDMGSTPYHAPDLRFFDFIGLTEGRVARARHSYGLNAYSATEHYRNQPKYDAEMRDYFFELAPSWAILTVYVPGPAQDRVAAAFEREPGPAAMTGYQHQNSYQFGITRDPRWEGGYVHVRTWARSRGYYLMLFRRKDLWDEVPGEVVLDAAPAGLGGVKAKLAHGIDLLGSEIEGKAIERHEAFFTTWWKVDGPLDPDVLFFVHVDSADDSYRTTLDHPPGDWMWPADRWRPGDVIEDRVLFQVPIGMGPGTYEVYIGIYRKSTGERFQILEGPDDGEGRIHLGTLVVTPLHSVIHQLIPPTDVDEQRKHPERILDPEG